MAKHGVNATHPLVADLCTEMAQAVYEELAHRNTFYKMYPGHSRASFVKHVAPTLRQEAVRTLSEMLARNDVPQNEKDKIYEALLLDKQTPNPHTWEVPELDTKKWMH